MKESVTGTGIVKVSRHQFVAAEDLLAVEAPLEIQLHYTDPQGIAVNRKVSVTMRTPGEDKALGAGFLFTEGIIRDREEIQDIVVPEENKVLILLKAGVQPVLQHAERNFYTTSSCGVCGKASIDAIKTVSRFPVPPILSPLAPELLYGLPQKLREQQEVFESTGGLHASALFDLQGHFIGLQEDVGRHNALDKVIGAALLQDELPLHKVILLLSGRASFELVQKAVMAGIPVIAAVGAPSSMAVALAAEQGIALIGFLRGERFNIYSGAERIAHTAIPL